MHATSLLVAFLFLGVATAGVIPDVASHNTTKPGPSAPLSSVHPYPSGLSSGAPIHSLPSGTLSNFPASRTGGVAPSNVSALHPPSRRAEPTGSYPPLSGTGAPTGISDRPTPSAQGLPLSHPSGQPTGAPHSSYHHTPHTAIANGTHPHPSVLPSGAPHRSGFPSGASAWPSPSASAAYGANPSDVGVHGSGSPSDVSVHPQPTPSQA